MIPFLKQVARHYENFEETCFVFPNRRSLVFFRKYLCENIKSPVFAPKMLTINEFFYEVAGVKQTDRVQLLLELYDSYKKLNPKAEPLDEFVFWGDVILGDFNDVDKYLVDPKQLFTNISDLKAIADTFEYLTDRQRKAIENFIRHFKDNQKKVTANLPTNPNARNVKDSFIQIWNLLYPLYLDYNKSLSEKSMAYEGMVYRSLAERLDSEPISDILQKDIKKYVFIGLNALNECEKKTLAKMRDAGLAEFCWDYSGDLIKNKLNKSSFFLKQNIVDFPQAFEIDLEEPLKTPEFNLISVPSAIGQAKQLPNILSKLDLKDPSDCAVVLPDETMLMPVLNTIPEEITDINVTMGYPMSSSGFYSFMKDISSLQMHTRKRGDSVYFYHKQVWNIFSSSILKHTLSEKEIQKIAEIKAGAKYYIPQEDFMGSDLFETIFNPVLHDLSLAEASQVKDFADYQLRVISTVAPKLKENPSMALELDFAMHYYKCINTLMSKSLAVQPLTFIKLLDQLLCMVSVPFKGEPIRGLQVMGPLEMRALDFKHLVILSANDGVFPRRTVSSSFIPPELRSGFSLPTYEYQDAVWAYYFYRMICRAETVWMVYDSRTEGLSSGEESRYIKQLRYHFGVKMNQYVATADISAPAEFMPIKKTQEHIDIIKNKCFSASSVGEYISCPAKFYFKVIEGLKEEGEVKENLDSAMIGNVYHDTMRALYYGEQEMMSDDDFDKTHQGNSAYRGMEKVTLDYLKSWQKREGDIMRKVKSLICSKLKTVEVTGRNLVTANIIVQYVLKTLERDIEVLRKEGVGAFNIIGLELKLFCEIAGMKFMGYIDRVDSFDNGVARIIDYKSGKDDAKQLDVQTDKKIVETLKNIFADKKTDRDKSKAVLQFYIYNRLLNSQKEYEDTHFHNSMYAVGNLFEEMPDKYIFSPEFCDELEKRVEVLFAEMLDPEVDFRLTSDVDTCEYCDFKIICGKRGKNG